MNAWSHGIRLKRETSLRKATSPLSYRSTLESSGSAVSSTGDYLKLEQMASLFLARSSGSLIQSSQLSDKRTTSTITMMMTSKTQEASLKEGTLSTQEAWESILCTRSRLITKMLSLTRTKTFSSTEEPSETSKKAWRTSQSKESQHFTSWEHSREITLHPRTPTQRRQNTKGKMLHLLLWQPGTQQTRCLVVMQASSKSWREPSKRE